MLNKKISWEFFRRARGEPFVSFESHDIRKEKLKDDLDYLRFTRAETDKDRHDRLCRMLKKTPESVLKTCRIDNSITGEWLSRMVVGKNVFLDSNVNILAHGGVTIGADTRIAAHTQIITVGHGIHPTQRHFLRCSPVHIGKNVTIGENVIIVNPCTTGAPLTIGDGAEILPNSIITSNVAAAHRTCGKPSALPAPVTNIADMDKVMTYDHARQAMGCNGRFIRPFYVEGDTDRIITSGNCLINRDVRIKAEGDIIIGNKLLMAPRAEIISGKNASIIIGDDVWLCAGAKIIAPENASIHIGAGTLIAAGAVVTQDVPDMTIVIGDNVHAKRITADAIMPVPDRWMDKKYVRHARQQTDAWNRRQRAKQEKNI